MAVKRPLVRYADTGRLEELRAVDTLPGAGGGGGAGITQAVLNVASAAINYAEIVVLDVTVSTASKITAQLVGELDAENDLEELSDSAITVFAAPETGQIRFILTSLAPFVGSFKTNYQVTA